MATYQDVIRSDNPYAGWALVEASGFDFAPWVGLLHLAGAATLLYQQPGPFPASEALHLAAGAKLTATFSFDPQAPFWVNGWVKFDSNVWGPANAIFQLGDNTTNGWSLYVQNDGKIHFFVPGTGGGDTNTGFAWPDTNWHFVSVGNINTSSAAPTIAIYVDGVIVFQGGVQGSHATAVHTLGFLTPGSSGGAARGASISYPAVFFDVLPPNSNRAEFLAATNPDAALPLTQNNPVNDTALLNAILAAVRHTY